MSQINRTFGHCVFVIFVLFCILQGCKEDKIGSINQDDRAPEQIVAPKVKRLPGAVEITYQLPADNNILYVEAETEKQKGKISKERSSYYNKSILIHGFGDTSEYEVKLYSVTRSLVKSEPVIVKVKPSEPSIMTAYKSLNMYENFGGVSIGFLNPNKEGLSINVVIKDEEGDWISAETFYTSQAKGTVNVRGFEPEKREFGVFIKDRWGNESELYIESLTPLYEEKLDPDNFKEMFAHLDTEAPAFSGSKMSNLWSGNFIGTTSTTAWYRTDNGSGIPHHFTFDLGVRAKLSRFVFWQRGAFDREDLLYSAGSPKVWEIWGSVDPSPNGSYEGWVLLDTIKMEKPSGLAGTALSNEDIDAAQEGHEFSIPSDAPSVKYIRIKILETWGKNDYMWMSELQFYGQIN